MLLTREQIANRLPQCADELHRAELHLIETANEVAAARSALESMEDALLLGNVPGAAIDGKNAEIRAAQMREHTIAQRADLAYAEQRHRDAAARVRIAQAEVSCWRSVARLMGGEE